MKPIEGAIQEIRDAKTDQQRLELAIWGRKLFRLNGLQNAIMGGLNPRLFTLREEPNSAAIQDLKKDCERKIGERILKEIMKGENAFKLFCRNLAKIGPEFSKRAAEEPLTEDLECLFFKGFGFPPTLEQIIAEADKCTSNSEKNRTVQKLHRQRHACSNALTVLGWSRKAVHRLHALVVILSRKAKKDGYAGTERDELNFIIEMAESDGSFADRADRFQKYKLDPSTAKLELFFRDTEPAEINASKLAKMIKAFQPLTTGKSQLSDVKRACADMGIVLSKGLPGRPSRSK
jgi:hypothetical protein